MSDIHRLQTTQPTSDGVLAAVLVNCFENCVKTPSFFGQAGDTHRPSRKRERNLIILQDNINGIKNKLEQLKLLIYSTHADIITIQETKLIPKPKIPQIHNFTTTVCTGSSHKSVSGLITLMPLLFLF